MKLSVGDDHSDSEDSFDDEQEHDMKFNTDVVVKCLYNLLMYSTCNYAFSIYKVFRRRSTKLMNERSKCLCVPILKLDELSATLSKKNSQKKRLKLRRNSQVCNGNCSFSRLDNFLVILVILRG